MNREKALRELNRVFGLYESGNRIIGTPELRVHFHYLDEWNQRYPDFNPVKLVALEEEGGYSWHFYAVFKNINRAFVLITGSGGSDSGPGTVCELQFFENIDSMLYHLKSKMGTEQYSVDWARELYHQVLTWIVRSKQ